MARNWTRRRFLATAGAAGALGAATAAGGRPVGPLGASKKSAAAAFAFSAGQREALLAAMDELIPASDGMPAAGAVGGMRALDSIAAGDPDLRRGLRAAASALMRRAKPKRFAALSSEERTAILAALEKEDPATFTVLRDCVYEGYYTDPGIWGRIGYEFYGPERPGPGLAALDEASLERTRARTPFWRKS